MSRSARLVAGLVVAAAGHATTAPAVGAVTPPLGVTVPVKLNGEKAGTPRTYTPADVLVDPDDARRVYAATVDLRSRRCGFYRSGDGGRTWAEGASPSPESHPLCGHAVAFMPMGALAMGRAGTIYYLHRAWSHRDEGPQPNTSVFLARSQDRGRTWATTTVRDARRGRAPENEVNLPADIAVDPTGVADVVYVSWTTTYPSALPSRPAEPTLSVSRDGGRSFSEPVDVSATLFDEPAALGDDIPEALRRKEHFGGAIPYLAIDGRGGLVVTWVRRTANVDVAGGHPRYVSRSDHGGESFVHTRMAAPSPVGEEAGAVVEWTAHGGAEGTFHAVYEGKEGELGDRDVHYTRSVDGGRTWSEARLLNDDDPAQLFAQLLPNLAAGPDGRLEVAWWDTRRAGARYASDVYHTHSDDGGATWSANVALNDVAVSRRFGSWVDDFGDARQPPALAASDATAVVVWDDTRLGTTASPLQDVYAVVVQYRPLRAPRSSSGTLYAASALAGMAAGGVVVLFRRRAHLARRRKVVSA